MNESRLGKNPKSRGSLDRLSSKLSARFWKLSASTYPPARRAGSPWGPRQEFFWFLNLSRCIYRPLFNDFFILFLFYSIFIFILAAILFKIYTTPWTGGMGIAQTRRIEIPNSVLCLLIWPKGDARLQNIMRGGVPTHSFWDIDFWFFAKFIICGIFYHIKSQLGCDPLKGVIQGAPPWKLVFWESWPCLWR